MRAFDVYLNKKRLCVAGIGDAGVLTAVLDQVIGKGRNELLLRVAGLVSSTGEHLDWTDVNLKVGDEVRVKIIKSASADKPRKRSRRDPTQDVRAQKRYVREMAKKFAWKIKVRPTKSI